MSANSAWPFPTGTPPIVSRTPATKQASAPATKAARNSLASSKARWTDAEISVLAKMHVAGKTPMQISTALISRSSKAIEDQLNDARNNRTPTGAKIAAAILAESVNVSRGPATKYASAPKAPAKAARGPATKLAASKVPAKVTRAPKTPTKEIPENHRDRWTDAADKQLLIGFARGMLPSELAALCGRTKSSVAGRLHNLGALMFDNVEMEFQTIPRVWLKVAASKA